MKVMDNKLFSIEPKQGKLAPGECRKVTLTYHHTMAGTDRLPVLLKLAGGREILVRYSQGSYLLTVLYGEIFTRQLST